MTEKKTFANSREKFRDVVLVKIPLLREVEADAVFLVDAVAVQA